MSPDVLAGLMPISDATEGTQVPETPAKSPTTKPPWPKKQRPS